jgi:hypothetical protein
MDPPGVHGQEARGRVIEIVDGVLELLEHVLLALALLRDLGDAPDRQIALGPNPHPVPGKLAAAARGRREPDLLASGATLPGGLCEAIGGFRDLGRAGEEPLDGNHVSGGGAGERRIARFA